MPYENIRVIAYSGYRGEESPRAFFLENRQITVVEVQDMWVEESVSDKRRKRFFIIKGNDNQTHKIYKDEETSEWFREVK